MAFKKLERFEAETRAAEAAQREEQARLELKKVVRESIPKHVMERPKRKRGRIAAGGLNRKEIAALKAKASRYLAGGDGMGTLEKDVQHTALVILLIDGVLGTEPWRASGGPHGGIIAANARLRYLENAQRILDDLRRRGGSEPKLLEGVFDAEPAESEAK